MAKSYWLINSNRSEVKRFTKNDKSIEGVFEYMFIDSGKIVGVLGKEPPIMTTLVSVEIELAREIYKRLLSQGWKKTEEVQKKKESQGYIFQLKKLSFLTEIKIRDRKLVAKRFFTAKIILFYLQKSI